MSKINTVIFDMDGTVLNTLDDLTTSVNYTMEKFGFPKITLEEYRRAVGNGIRKAIELTVPEGTSQEVIDEMVPVFKEHYDVHCLDKTGPYAGIIELMRELKKRGAGRIFVCATFGLFTDGLARFDEAHESGLIYRVVTTNSIYQTPELLSREYYLSADMSKYIALLIDTLNHDQSISEFLDPTDRIQKILKQYGQI